MQHDSGERYGGEHYSGEAAIVSDVELAPGSSRVPE